MVSLNYQTIVETKRQEVLQTSLRISGYITKHIGISLFVINFSQRHKLVVHLTKTIR